jgi:hypothetical protein
MISRLLLTPSLSTGSKASRNPAVSTSRSGIPDKDISPERLPQYAIQEARFPDVGHPGDRNRRPVPVPVATGVRREAPPYLVP